jgi:hypothetical protein
MWKRTAGAAIGLAIVTLAAFPQRRAELAAQAVHESIAIEHFLDRAKQRVTTFRTRMILGVLSDAALDQLCHLSYGSIAWYRPTGNGSWPALFAWEQAFVDRYLPSPPASILVGGAGAGREAYHLASMGHQVVAFDPIQAFVDIMVHEIAPDLEVRVFRASYQDLPHLGPATPGAPGLDLTIEPTFEAAILGWCSFSHILQHADQVHALRTLASIVHGPILISFFSRDPVQEVPATFPHSLFPSRHRDPSFGFQAVTGVYRQYIASEIFALCAEAGVSVIEAVVHKESGHFSYVIVQGDPLRHEATCPDPGRPVPDGAIHPLLGQ